MEHEILEKLKRGCEARGLIYDDIVYEDEIDNAIEVVNERRGYKPTAGKPFEEKYKHLIYRMALYTVSKMGAEGEISHKENGTNRVYQTSNDYPRDMLNQIIPLARGV